MKEVADILGHEDIRSTTIYAQLDHRELSLAVALAGGKAMKNKTLTAWIDDYLGYRRGMGFQLLYVEWILP